MVNIILLGLPGSGKGTQAKILQNTGNFNIISTGFMLRSSKFARELVDSGQLIDDSEIVSLVNNEVSKINTELCDGLIFDGFPRTVGQAIAMRTLFFKGRQIVIDFVINIVIREEIALMRLESRVACKECDAIYNIITGPPKIEGICDNCGNKIYKRTDDSRSSSIRERLSIAKNNISSIIKYYENIDAVKVINIDGSLDKNEVFSYIKKYII